MSEKKNKRVEFPDCWEEISPSEWAYLLKLRFMLGKKKGLSLADIVREWSRFVLHGRGYSMTTSVDRMVLIHELSRTLEWMWGTDENGMLVMTFDSTVNLLPTWRNFRGPRSHGSDLTFGEFRHAMAASNDYTKNHHPDALDALVGILYRKPGNKKLGLWREPFNGNMVDLYAHRTDAMPEYLKWGVYVWFSSFCQFLLSGTFIIDGHEISFEPLFKVASNDGGDQSLGLDSILYSVAESGVFGNVEGTDNALLLRVMMKLLDDNRKAEALKKNMGK